MSAIPGPSPPERSIPDPDPDDDDDDDDAARAERTHRARRTLLFFFFLLFFALSAALSREDPLDDSGGGEPAASPQPSAAPDPQLLTLHRLADEVWASARGLAYPAAPGERFVGAWRLAGPASLAPSMLRPALAPNFTVEFGLAAPTPGASPAPRAPAALAFAHDEGDLQLAVRARAPYARLPTLMDVAVGVEIFDGTMLPSERRTGSSSSSSSSSSLSSSSTKTPKLMLVAHGVYAADAGLLLMVGSNLGGGVNVRPVGTVTASPSATLQPSASLAASPPPSPLPTQATSAASPAADGGSGGGGGGGGGGRPPPRAPEGGRQLRSLAVTGEEGRCDLLIAMRMRPVLYDPSFSTGTPTWDSLSSDEARRRRLLSKPSPSNEQPGPGAVFTPRTLVPTALEMAATSLGLQSASSLIPVALRPLYELALKRYAASISERAAALSEPEPATWGSAFAGAMALAPNPDPAAPSGIVDDLARLAGAVFAPESAEFSASSTPLAAPLPPASPLSAARRLQEAVRLGLIEEQDRLRRDAGTLDAPANARASGPRRAAAVHPEAYYEPVRYLPLFGHIVSPNCNFSLNVSAVRESWNGRALEGKASGYALMATLSSLAMIVVTTYQLVVSSSQSAAFRISLLTIGAQAVTDCWLSFVYTVAGMLDENIFSSFASAAFLHLVLFAMLEMQLLLMILKARRPEMFNEGWSGVRREVLKLYVVVSACIVSSFAAMFMGSEDLLRVVLFCAFSLWLPQILHAAQHDVRHGLRPAYVLVSSAARLLPLLYLACPYNVIFAMFPDERTRDDALDFASLPSEPFGFLEPTPAAQPWMLVSSANAPPPALSSPDVAAQYWAWARFAVAMTCWVAAQVAVLFLQERADWGPRFFVPYVFLPAKYDYHRIIEVRDGRVVPNPRQTAAWLLHMRPAPREPELPAAAVDATAQPPAGAGSGAGAQADVPTADQLSQRAAAASARLVAYAQRSARRVSRTSQVLYSGGVVFASGMAQLAEDGVAYVRRRLRPRAGAARRISSGAARRQAGAAAAVSSLGGGGSAALGSGEGASGDAPPSSWFSLLSPRSRGRRYAHLDSGVDADDSAGASAGDSGAGGGDGKAPDTPAGLSVGDNEAGATAPVRGGSSDGGGGSVDGDDDVESPPPDPLVGNAATSGTIDCVVCQEAFAFPVLASSYMVTPCDHLFHKECLRPWLDQALQCPTCRLPLPVYN